MHSSNVLTWCGLPYSKSGKYFDTKNVASDSDMTIVGIPYDGGRTATGGQDQAPRAIRLLETFETWRDYRIGELHNLKLVDAGDLTIDHRAAAKSLNEQADYLMAVWKQTSLLTVLGGDHSITSYLLELYNMNTGKLPNVMHLDAHSDTWLYDDPYLTQLPTHDSWVSWSLDHQHINRIWTFGVREMGPNEDADSEYNSRRGIRMGDLMRQQLIQFVDTYEKKHPGEPLYLSVDMDVVDPAFCPGVAYPVPGGWTPQMLFRTIEYVVSKLPVMAVDIVETTPALDRDNLSVRLAHRSVLSVVKGLKRRLDAKV